MRPSIRFMDAPIALWISNALPVDRVEEKPRLSPLVCARQALEATVADPSACPHISAASAGLSRPPAEFPYQAIGLRARAPLRCSGWSGHWRERRQTWR